MIKVKLVLPLILIILFFAGITGARNILAPADYGRVILRNHVANSGLAPVVFDHWLHRSKFTCRLCHVDIGFAMKAGDTDVTAEMNMRGLYCGVCHNGKRTIADKKIFASCEKAVTAENRARCERCHSLSKKGVREYEFTAYTEKLPKTVAGSGIDWEEAENKGLIKPIDVLEGVSVKRSPLKIQKDFSIEAKAPWIEDVIFSHKKHALWNGCEVCHPDIFPSVKKGTTKYTMFEIEEGQYCGVCHDKVAFPIYDCQRCHINPVQL
ncbi:MAG TPA: c(7)-type cytochrome triheme domain-containing protein [Nitrospirota bacterium]|nr:c(7)-type cytochrome triheme domain-containing protein [Nitrospirota bacterium]